MAQTSANIRTVYDFPVAAHLCTDGTVRNVKLVKRSGEQPHGVCSQCQLEFQYRKPKPSRVRQIDAERPPHF